MNTSLDALDPVFKPLAFALLARSVEARIPVVIINTRRTDAEQEAAIASGVSWVKRSKHQDGLAIDIAPYAVWSEHGDKKIQWDADDPLWMRLGQLGESLNLRWGGRWKQRDMGHFEYAGAIAPVIGVPV